MAIGLPEAGRALSPAELDAAKADVSASLASLWQWLEADIDHRLA